jgi:hypothetical protein
MRPMTDVRQMALREVQRIKRDYGLADDEIVDRRELQMIREGHGFPVDGADAGSRFLASPSLAEWRAGGVASVTVPVLEAREIEQAATVAFPSGRTLGTDNALAEWAAPVLRIATVVPEQAGLARDLGLTATELTTGTLGLIPGAASRETTLTGRGTDQEMIRLSTHSGVQVSLLDGGNAEFVRRTINDLVTRLLMRALARDLIEGTGATAGDQRQLSGLIAATITSVDAATGDKVAKVSEAVAAVQQAWSERAVLVIANPTTLRVLREASTWRRDRLPDEVVIVPFGRLTAGTVWVVAERTVTLFSSSVLIEVAYDHGATDYLTGRAVVQPTVFAWADVAHPNAAAKVINF